jgi:hypothetical protein
MKKILSIVFVLYMLCNQNLFTESDKTHSKDTTNVIYIDKEKKESSNFFRNLIICCAVFVAGYIVADSKNGIYVIIDGQRETKIELLDAYLYKLGIKALSPNGEIIKTFDSKTLDIALREHIKSRLGIKA